MSVCALAKRLAFFGALDYLEGNAEVDPPDDEIKEPGVQRLGQRVTGTDKHTHTVRNQY